MLVIYKVLLVRWKMTICNSQGQPSGKSSSASSSTAPPGGLLPLRGLQIHDPHQGSHSQHIYSACCLILCTEVEITVAIAGSIGGIGVAPASGTSMETGTSPFGISPAVRHWDIFWNPRGTSLGWHLYLLHHGMLALGSLQMRQTWKYTQVPTFF